MICRISATIPKNVLEQPKLCVSHWLSIYDSPDSLKEMPHRGRKGRKPNTREMMVTYLWVVFSFTRRPHWNTGPGERTAMACDPETLTFIERREDGGFNL